jgi:hypothetical protein
MNTLEMWIPVAAQKPEILDNVNWDSTFRDSVRNAGLPSRWLLEAEEVGKMRQERAAAIEEAKAQAQQAQMADSASKVGSIREDSLVGKALQKGGRNGASPLGI